MASIAEAPVGIVDCDDERIEPLQAFFARVYRPDYTLCDASILRWQFLRTPGAMEGPWHFKLALVHGDLAGCLGYIPLDLSEGDRVIRGAWVVNWMIAPEHRHLGLGPLLMREVVRQFDATLNIGPNDAAREILTRMGWHSYGALPRYVAVLDYEAAGAIAESGTIDWPRPTAPRQSGLAGGSQAVYAVARFDDRATELWDRFSRSPDRHVVGTRRSAAFLNWRYADHPAFEYRLFGQYDRHELTGLAVYRIEVARATSIRIGRLVELVEPQGVQHGSRSSLVDAVLDDARAAGVAVMDFFCTDRRLEPLMEGHGFVAGERTSQIPMLFQPIDRRRRGIWFMAQCGAARPAAHWYVTTGDGDQDRPN